MMPTATDWPASVEGVVLHKELYQKQGSMGYRDTTAGAYNVSQLALFNSKT